MAGKKNNLKKRLRRGAVFASFVSDVIPLNPDKDASRRAAVVPRGTALADALSSAFSSQHG